MRSAPENILYGIHPVAEALAARRRKFMEILVAPEQPGSKIRKIIALAECANIPIRRQPRESLQRLSGTDSHQGIAARVSPLPTITCSRLLGGHCEPSIFLLLDSIMDPGNLGALIRTALCVGVKGVIIPKDRCAGPTPAVSKASAGALEHIRLARVTNLVSAMKDLKKNGGWIIGLDGAADHSIYATDFTGTAAIVIGGEESGIRPLVKRECDLLAHIPMSAQAVNSLNASVAGGIVLYEAFRQQRQQASRT